MNQLIRLEISQAKLPDKAIKLLNGCDKLIGYYDRLNKKPDSIALFPKDYIYLSRELEKQKQVLSERAYRGYRLVKAGIG